MKSSTPSFTVTERQPILIWVRSCFILAFIIWLSCSLPVIIQFAVHILSHGPHFETQMLSCSYRSKKSIYSKLSYVCKSGVLGSLLRLLLSLFQLRTRLTKKLNRNLNYLRRGIYPVIENLSQSQVNILLPSSSR